MKDALRDWLVKKYPLENSESPMESLLHAGVEIALALTSYDLPTMRRSNQAVMGNYRADFLYSITGPDGQIKHLVIEVDGHDFHERTKEQAARDKARDRWMTGMRYEVMRFAGSEVWANPIECGNQILDRMLVLRTGKSRKEAITEAGLAAIKALFA